MCILSYLPAGVPVDAEGLWIGGANNPHGHGWAIVTDGAILMGKSLDLDEALETFQAARERHQDGPALFHSRWATHGSRSVANCHPFLVGGSHKTVVAHNGVLPSEAHPAKGDDRSDTRLFADELLPTRFRRLDRKRAFRALTEWCGSGNKLVILTVDPRYRHNVYVVNEQAGRWDTRTGIWHSNDGYRDYPVWGSACAGLSGAVLDDDDLVGFEVECQVCGGEWFDRHGYCETCRACGDCYEPVEQCQCWVRECALVVGEGECSVR